MFWKVSRCTPQTYYLVPSWNLNFVFSCLLSSLFASLATAPLLLISMKTTFLVAITSVRRLSEFQEFLVDHRFIGFYRPPLNFMPKFVSAFHLNQTIHLPIFFPKTCSSKAEEKLPSTDVQWALAFYLNHTKSFRSSPRLLPALRGLKGNLL